MPQLHSLCLSRRWRAPNFGGQHGRRRPRALANFDSIARAGKPRARQIRGDHPQCEHRVVIAGRVHQGQHPGVSNLVGGV